MTLRPDRAVNLTTHPSSKRACFPADCLPPFQRVDGERGLADLVRVPSVPATAAISFAAGAAACWLMLRSGSCSDQGPRCPLDRFAPLGIAAAIGAWVLNRRCPTFTPVNERLNVSSDPSGPCVVTGRALLLTNSHAGTHADTTAHFHHLRCGEPKFEEAQYSGAAVVLDVSAQLEAPGPVTVAALEAAASRAQLDWASVERLLLRTDARAEAAKPDEWGPFSYLVPDTVRFLRQNAPHLVLVGIDGPSVDAPTAAPIASHSHGALAPSASPNGEGDAASGRPPIAILENLELSRVARQLHDGNGVATGAMLTVFNPMADFEDARGCSVYFDVAA